LHAISPTTTKQLIMRLKAPGPRMARLRLALMRGVCFDTHAVLDPETVYQTYIPLNGFEVLDKNVGGRISISVTGVGLDQHNVSI
jgi:hypothetical protein